MSRWLRVTIAGLVLSIALGTGLEGKEPGDEVTLTLLRDGEY